MNQKKIGTFIASCRKEKGYTQAALAEKLGITDRAISKWETGKSMPDASIMLELCELLNINVNELLLGEHIVMDNYKEKAEATLVELKQKEESSNKSLLAIEVLLIVISSAFLILTALAAKYAVIDPVWQVCMVSIASVLMITCLAICVTIEIKAGYYECPECGHKYVPDLNSYLWAPHMGWTRKMKCPKCKVKSWQKKVLTR